MIFVTVGTHEQPFNRLVKCIDELKGKKVIDEEVVIQTGFSTYEPKHCKWQKIYPFEKMVEMVNEARIVITHGGPSSFIMSLQVGKVPIVIPRQVKFNEHVNNHQVTFSKAVADRHGNIIVIEDIDKLKDMILNYNDVVQSMSAEINSNNNKFCSEFKILVDEIFTDTTN